MLSSFLAKRWSSFFTLPAISVSVLLFMYLTLYPIVRYDYWKIELSFMNSVYVCSTVAGIITALATYKLYQIKFFYSFIAWIVFTLMAVLTIPEVIDGNPSFTIVPHLTIYQIASVFFVSCFIYSRRLRLAKGNFSPLNLSSYSLYSRHEKIHG